MSPAAPDPEHVLPAGCIAIAGRGILVAGPPGSGKSSLALALIDRGAALVGDDGVVVSTREGQLWAAPHPRTQGLLEVRNLGLLPMPFLPASRICLKLNLDAQAPRYIDRAERELVSGVELPVVRLWPEAPMLVLRAELALSRYGLA